MSTMRNLMFYASIFTSLMFVACDQGSDLTSPSDSNSGEVEANNGYTDTVADALAQNCPDHDDSQDYQWDDADIGNIVFSDNGIAVDGTGVAADGGVVTITAAATYKLSGTIAEGQLIVDTSDNGVVRLVMDGMTIRNSASAPVYIKNADKVVIVLSENSENTITDGTPYVFEDPTSDEPNAAIFSKTNLTICGNGSLSVYGNYNDGDIFISKCYKGIESTHIAINSGTIHITASDDGLNAADGTQGQGDIGGPGPGGPGGPGGFMPIGNYYLYINGGYIAVNTDGDGFDINGSIVMTNGTVIVHGPTANMNGAVDYDRTFNMSGGFLVAAGSSGMAQAPSTSSTQYSLLINFARSFDAKTLFYIEDSQGREILSFAPAKAYQSVAFSSAELVKGATFNIYYGGSSTGSVVDGLYKDGTYTPGTKYTSFTISSVVTKLNIR